jgi:hypothetical protein
MAEARFKNGDKCYTFDAKIDYWLIAGITPNKSGGFDYLINREGVRHTALDSQLFATKVDAVRAVHARAQVEIDKIKKKKIAGAGEKMQIEAVKKQVAKIVAESASIP